MNKKHYCYQKSSEWVKHIIIQKGEIYVEVEAYPLTQPSN